MTRQLGKLVSTSCARFCFGKLSITLNTRNLRPLQLSEELETSAAAVFQTVRDHGLEGIVAKWAESLYEAGRRSGALLKYRINLGQEFVVGGYTPGSHGFDALVVGFYRGKDLIFVSRLRTLKCYVRDS